MTGTVHSYRTLQFHTPNRPQSNCQSIAQPFTMPQWCPPSHRQIAELFAAEAVHAQQLEGRDPQLLVSTSP